MAYTESEKITSAAVNVCAAEFSYANGRPSGNLEVLKNVSFSVNEGEFVSFLGPSGCGKTTLLRLIAGLLKPAHGEVVISNSRQRLGYVFQTPNLLPWLNTSENILLPLQVRPGKDADDPADDFEALLNQLGLEPYGNLYPWQLSLGMQMRTNLGRALINRPDILLLDEPFSALDAISGLRLQRDVLRIWKERAVTCILVTHNIVDAVSMSDRVLLLSARPASIVKEYDISINRGADGLRMLDSELDRLVHRIINDMQADVPRAVTLTKT